MKKRVAIPSLIVPLVAVFLAVSAGHAAAASNGKIAFTGWDSGYSRIYVMNADGSDVTALTDSIHGDYAPAWSPDGTKIAFASNRDGTSDLWIMNADGTDQQRLYDSPCGDLWAPAWSPDGAKLVFSHCWGWIAVVNVDGAGFADLWYAGGFGAGAYSSWSPDGTKITFSDNQSIFAMGADGSNVTQLTSTDTNHPNYDPNWSCGLDDDPEWSRDGTRIVFHRQDSCGLRTTVIFIMDADGHNQIQLTNDAETGGDWAPSWSPSWSPDGTKIVFRREDPVTFDTLGIWVMSADGSSPTSLGGMPGDHPSWQPVSAPTSPAEAIEQLIASVNTLVASGELTYGNGVALAAKLYAALQQVAGATQSPGGITLSAAAAGGSGGRAITAAKGQLGAFINQVNALVKSRRLSQARGQALIDSASAIIASL